MPGEETADGPKDTENLLGYCKRHRRKGGKKSIVDDEWN